MKIATLLTLSLLVAACAGGAGYNPRYYYDTISVANYSGGTISDFKIQVGPDGVMINCAEVTEKRLCERRIGRHPYPDAPSVLSWVNSEGKQMTEQVSLSPPAYFETGTALMLMIDIKKDGTLKAWFEQDTIFDDG